MEVSNNHKHEKLVPSAFSILQFLKKPQNYHYPSPKNSRYFDFWK